MAKNDQVIIKQGWLMGIYFIVPVLFIVFLIDLFIFNGEMRPHLTANVANSPIYLLLFELPHIVASFFGFADREYIKHYRSHLLYRLPVLVAGIILLFYVSPIAGMILYGFNTMYHVIRQQTGIALTMTHKRDWWHEVWTYLGIVTIFVVFLLVQITNSMSPVYSELLFRLLFLLALAFVAVSVYMIIRSRKRHTKIYVGSVSISIFSCYVFFLFEYIFLAIFVLRFIHEITAFIFYVAHDTARNRVITPNFIYRVTKKIGLPVIITTPLVAISIAYILRSEFLVLQFGVLVLLLPGFIHYYLEGVMWKHGSLHREQLRFE
jgi:hypothetical protein